MIAANGISVIICCYNSADRLPTTLQYIVNQQFSSFISWEVIVVDNASTDNTSKVAADIWEKMKKANVPFSVLQQPIAGKTYAIDKGVEFAKYNFFLICDDDNWLAPDFLQNAFEIMSSNSNIGVLGSRTYPIFEAEPPNWFLKYSFYFAIGKQSEKEGDITQSKGWVWGAGSMYRKDIYDQIKTLGLKKYLTCRKGNELSTGGDVELCYQYKKLGYTIWYDEHLSCGHFMPASRFHIKRFWELCFANGYASPFLDMYRSIPKRHIHILRFNIYWLYNIYLCMKTLNKNRSRVDKLEYNCILFTTKGRLKKLIELNFSYDKLLKGYAS